MNEPELPPELRGCPDCGADAVWSVGQRGSPDGLCWWRSLRCDGCGTAIEADDVGVPPEIIRRYLLERDGIWRVQLRDPVDRLTAMKALRDLFDLDLAGVAGMVRASNIFVGTRSEADWLTLALECAGTAVNVIPGEPWDVVTAGELLGG